MTTEAELREVVDGLGKSLVIVGCGDAGRAAVEGLDAAAERATTTDGVEDARTVLAAVELGDVTENAATLATEASDRGATSIVVAAVARDGRDAADSDALTSLRDAADTVLLVAAQPTGTDTGADADGDESEAAAGLRHALEALRRLVEEAGVVNLDLADVHTVLSAGGLALFAQGQADGDSDGEQAAGEQTNNERADDDTRAGAVVSRALADAPGGFGVDHAPTVLVHVVCGAGVNVTTAGAVVDAVRADVAADAHVIWGATVDDALPADALGVDLVVGGVVPTVEAGDPCPRCGATIVEYTLGEASTVACDACGYAGVSTELR